MTGPSRAKASPITRTSVVISTFPPDQCGVARYAEQQCAAMERAGSVRRLRAERRGPFYRASPLLFLRAMAGTSSRETIIVHWNRFLYVSGRTWTRFFIWLSLGLMLRGRDVTVIFHDPDFAPVPAGRARILVRRWLDDPLRDWVWATGRGSYLFHTTWERNQFSGTFRSEAKAETVRLKSDLVDHRASFVPAVPYDRAQARSHLGLGLDGCVFLCIGFLVEHKGFERAIEAFGCSEAAAQGRLYVVGSRGPAADRGGYVGGLRALAEGTAGVELVEGFVSDEEFDTWVIASDAVVCPYAAASSSGVVARAQVLGRTVIASGVGGLRDQLRAEDILLGPLLHAELIHAFDEVAQQAGSHVAYEPNSRA